MAEKEVGQAWVEHSVAEKEDDDQAFWEHKIALRSRSKLRKLMSRLQISITFLLKMG